MENGKKPEGGHFPPSRTSAGHGCHRARHGYSPTSPDSALCSRRVRASSIQRWCERAPSRERLQWGRSSAINLPLGGDIRGERPLPSALCPPAPRVRRRSVARLSEHTGGLGAPQAVGLEAPPRVVIHSGGERIGMRDGGESRTLPHRSDPHPPAFTVWFLNSEDRLKFIIIHFTL